MGGRLYIGWWWCVYIYRRWYILGLDWWGLPLRFDGSLTGVWGGVSVCQCCVVGMMGCIGGVPRCFDGWMVVPF